MCDYESGCVTISVIHHKHIDLHSTFGWFTHLVLKGARRRKRLSPISTGGRCTPRYNVQSWQLDTTNREAAAMTWQQIVREVWMEVNDL